MKQDLEFFVRWVELSEEGVCDAVHGAECERVFAEWKKHGRPANIGHFIATFANINADGSGREQLN